MSVPSVKGSKFTFDYVFDPTANNRTIYEKIGKGNMQKFMEGFNVCLFC